jgi:Poly A polymerase regulatory subunit
MSFSRKINIKGGEILPFKTKQDYNGYEQFLKEQILFKSTNCHWGQIKLFYSELEFLLLVNKYINIDDCLIVYVGAADGFRLKNFFIKNFFPNTKYLLYDPMPFRIEQTNQITIKTGSAGWFDDDKIEEVLKIANGRKILYITDIRQREEEKGEQQKSIYDDMMKQQKWGIMMDAEFMLIKFRNFYFQDPKEINFIDNNFVDDVDIKNKIVFTKDKNKHSNVYNWLLYLSGELYTQIYAPMRSTETRLFVKKIKYHKNADQYKKEEQEKYKLKYYDTTYYDGLLNYFNTITRKHNIDYKKSIELSKYIPGTSPTYTFVSEYYLIRKYCLYNKKKPTLKNIFNLMIDIYLFFNKHYNNNLIQCIPLNYAGMRKDTQQNLTIVYFRENNEKWKKQFADLKNTKLISQEKINKFINSYNLQKSHVYDVFTIKDGNMQILMDKEITVDDIVSFIINEYKEKNKK